MEILVNSDFITELLKEYLPSLIGICFPSGLLLGAGLELFGYGIFKAVSLINIKYE